MSDPAPEVQAHTIRLELVDEPGALRRALGPVAEHGGNLLSVFHERGNVTPRGHIPVEVDLEATPEAFEAIVAALRDEGIDVVQAGAERYSESVTVVLSGHLVDTGLSDTLRRIGERAETSVTEFALSAPGGTADVSSARLTLATPADGADAALSAVRAVAAEKDLRVVEPLAETDGN
jgi:ACT domain-containing protein